MKLQQFDGGVVSRLAPQLLSLNQGVVYENIDNASGVLKPLKDKLPTDIEVARYNKYFVAGKEWLSSEEFTEYIEFQRRMYLTDRVNRPKKYSDGVYDFLGIKKPGSKSTATNINKAEPLEEITVRNKISVGGLPASDFDYLLFNVKNGVYSTPLKFTVYASTTATTRAVGEVVAFNETTRFGRNPITTEDTPSYRAIEFKNIGGTFGDSALLFRYHEDAWRLVHTFTSKTGEFLDSVFDVSNKAKLDETKISTFKGVYQYVYTFYNNKDGAESAPSELSAELEVNSGAISVSLPSASTDTQVTHKRLYRVGGDLATFTMVAQLDKSVTVYVDKLSDTEVDGRPLESSNYYEAPEGLQYLSEAYAMLFGAKGSSLLFTPVGKPNAWPPEYEIQFENDITGIGVVANGILVFTRFKTYIVTGTGPTTLSQQSLSGDHGCIAFESIQEASEGTVIWASLDGLCTSSGNNVVSLTKTRLGAVELKPVSSAVYDETYYCHNEDGTTLVWDYRFQSIVKWLNLGIESLTKCCSYLYGYKEGKLYFLYKDTNNLTLKYKSPLLVEGAFSENKTYKKVYVRSEGDIILNIIIDNNIVASFNLAGADTHQLQIPQHLQRGYSIQFEVEGTGTVNEIEYVAGPRQNA